MNDHGKKLERGLTLVGCSAIEDKLQDGVPETIQQITKANVRLWVLTGDKQETAIEIGRSCNLIQREMALIKLSSNSEAEFKNRIDDELKKYKIQDKSFEELNTLRNELTQKLSIVIDGQTLAWALNGGKDLCNNFFKLGFISNTCICCRVSPAQKMHVVQLAKKNGDWITLGIGDGANDVSMIQEAHVGVGIAGKEGT